MGSIQLMAPVINLVCVEALAMSPLVCQQMLRRTWQMRLSSFLTSNMDTSAALCRCNPSKFEFVVCNAISCVQMFCVLREVPFSEKFLFSWQSSHAATFSEVIDVA